MRILKFVVLTVYLFTVLYIVFGIGNDWRFSDKYANITQSANLIPFGDKIYFFQHPELWGGNNFYFTIKEIIGNLLILFPLPMILMLGYRVKTIKKAVVYSFFLSLFVETTQFITAIGHADIDDLILNTIGAATGALLAHIIQKKLTSCNAGSF